MILVDANLLLYAAVSSFPAHAKARRWLDAQLGGRARVGLPWPSLLAFVRIASNPRVFEKPASVAHAWSRAMSWLESPAAWVPEATDRHAAILDGFLNSVVTKSKLVPDAHLAALAIEHGLTLCTTDSGFSRFPGLRTDNPLAA